MLETKIWYPIKTRIPKQTNTVLFSAPIHADALKLAKIFSGSNDRVANAMELMRLRLSYGYNHPIWDANVTTMSTEWFGLNHQDEACIAILHNPGPIMNDDLVEYKRRQVKGHQFNCLPRTDFLDILDGKYGKITCVPFLTMIEEINERARRPIFSGNYMHAEELKNNSLMMARLGTDPELTNDYVKKLEGVKFSKDCDRLKVMHFTSFQKIMKCDYDDYVWFLTQDRKTTDRYQNLNPLGIDLGTEAVGHFLSFNGYRMIEPSRIHRGAHFLSIMAGEDVMRLGNSVYHYDSKMYNNNILKLFVSNDKPFNADFFQLDQIDKIFYARVNDKPTFMAKSVRPLSQKTIKLENSDVNYIIGSAAVLNDSGANSFKIQSVTKKTDNEFLVVVTYYKTEVYEDRRIATEQEVISDPSLFGRIV